MKHKFFLILLFLWAYYSLSSAANAQQQTQTYQGQLVKH